jgi:preprotein translocase subunit SecA
MGISEDQEIAHKMLSSAIENAQKRIENNNFGIRKNLLEYDQVMNDQREIIYAERLKVLNGESMRDSIMKMVMDVVENYVDSCIGDDSSAEEWDLNDLNVNLLPIVPLEPVTLDRIEKPKKAALKQQLKEEAIKLYEDKESQFPQAEAMREVERVVLLRCIDRKWMNHIDDMDQLRQSIGLQSYAQKDPVVQYKFLGYEMFEEMTKNIRHDTVGALMHLKIEQKVEREQVAKATGTNKDDTVAKGPYRRKEAKIGRNAPCPCGSGKKYKQCHGRFA